MDWSNEEYVRLYRRETDDDLLLPWEARAVWHEMLKRFDRSGLIETRRGPRGLAAIVRIPLEVVEGQLPALLEDGRLQVVAMGYFAPNFLPAQEAIKSDRQRARESRLRRADRAGRAAVVTNRSDTSQTGSNRDGPSQNEAERHALSRDVTLPLLPLLPLLSNPDPLPPSASGARDGDLDSRSAGGEHPDAARMRSGLNQLLASEGGGKGR